MSWRAAAAAALVTAAVCFLIARGNSYQTFIIVTVGLTAIVGIGLNVLLGLSGQISLGHVAFYAIGAYAVGILPPGTIGRSGRRLRWAGSSPDWPASCWLFRRCGCAVPISPW
jgi:ABC-type branched-subunit amino acid transport system permease subunit